MKKSTAALLILLALLTVFAAAGAEIKVVDIVDPGLGYAVLTYRLHSETKTAEVLAALNTLPESYAIPAIVTDENIEYRVTAIGDRVFEGNTVIRDLTIPAGITGIGYAAFSRCTYLERMIIPNTVLTIGQMAFYAARLQKVFFLGSTPPEIMSYAFDGISDNSVFLVPSYTIEAYKNELGLDDSRVKPFLTVKTLNGVTAAGNALLTDGNTLYCESGTELTLGSGDTMPLLLSMLIALAVGTALALIQPRRDTLRAREGFAIVALPGRASPSWPSAGSSCRSWAACPSTSRATCPRWWTASSRPSPALPPPARRY